jgi:chitinase
VVVSPAHRAEFVRSAVKLVEDYGLDGLDVDYEYPQNDAQARGYVDLLRELRVALDQHARHKHADYRFLLTVSAITTSRTCRPLTVGRLQHHVDQRTIESCMSGKWFHYLTSGILCPMTSVSFFIASDPFFLWLKPT